VKVGDLVVQGTKVLKLYEDGKPKAPSKNIGTVIAVRPHDPDSNIPETWRKNLGRLVDVLWPSGKISEDMAENSLEVIND